MTDDLTTSLSRFPDLTIASSTAAMALMDQGIDIRQVARRLDVAYLIEGSVRTSDARLRVGVRLVDAESGHQVWADQYDRGLDDIFAIQDDVVGEVAARIHPALEAREAHRHQSTAPADLGAWELSLRGWRLVMTNTPDACRDGIALLEMSLQRDPARADTYGRLAFAWAQAAGERWSIKDRDTFREVDRVARVAHHHDPDDPLALAALAMAEAFAGNYEAALTAAHRGLAVAPHGVMTLYAAGIVHLFRGDTGRAIDALSQSWKRAMYEPGRHQVAAGLAFAQYLSGNYDAALAWAKRGLEISDYLQLHLISAAALGMLGRVQDARLHLDAIQLAAPAIRVLPLMRNVRWEREEDRDHYREGLVRAGMPR